MPGKLVVVIAEDFMQISENLECIAVSRQCQQLNGFVSGIATF